MFQKLVQLFLQKFVKNMGRGPQNPAEWMQIQDEAVRYLNKTKGAPSIKKDPFQGWDPKIVGKDAPSIKKDIPGETKITIDDLLKGPVRSKGPKGDRIWDFSQKKGEVIDFPNKGIRGLMEKGDVTVGTAPKTLPETLKAKKDRGILLRDSEEGIARIKRENKEAIKRFKEKNPDKFQFGGIAPLIGEPSYAANFYDDRTPYKVGKIVKGIKTLLKKKKPKVKTTPFTGRVRSDLETIHLPKVKKDRLATADELEDYREILDPSGEAYIVEEGMMVKELDKMVAEQKAYERHMFLEYKKGNLDPTAGDKSPARKQFLEKKLEEMEMSGDKRLMTRDEIEELSSFDLGTEMDAAVKKPRVHTLDERTALKQKYPKLTDDLLEKILADDNPQRKADVLGTMDEYLKLLEIGKSEGEAFDIITRSFSKTPTKHAEGGRADFIFGGSAGFKAFLRKLMGGRKKAFPKSIDREGKRIPDDWKKKMFPKEFEREKELRILYLENLLTGLKHDKKMMQTIESNKALKDEGLNFLTKQLEESYAPHLKKYTDIDKDILNMEQMIANQMKKQGRKPNSLGGRIGYAGGGKTGLPAVTMGTPQPGMQQPQMPVGPQPTGIPGGTIVAQNQMQQSPWMGSQMQQGIGGMPRPGGMPQRGMPQRGMPQRGQPIPGGMPRPMAAEGGRIGFGLGGFNKARRAFLKMLAGLTGAGVAAGTGLLKFGKAAKVVPKVTETIVQSNAAGMPAWFPSLVKRVIKEGEDISKTAATIERQTVHTVKLPESGTPVQVTRDLVTDDIIVDIGEQTKHGWAAGRHGQPTQLILKKGEWIEPTKTKKGVKTKDEFFVEEAEFTGGHPENVKFEESAIEKYGDHASDFTEVEKFAVGKNVDKKIVGKKAKSDAWAEGRAESQAEDIDFASGGLARMLGE